MKRLADRDRRLRLVRSVVAVLEPQAVPVHGRVEVAVVGHVDGDRRALRDPQRRAGDRAVVGEHPHRRVADPLLDRHDLELELVAVGELDQLGLARVRQALGLARELDRLAVAVRARGSCIGYILQSSELAAGAGADRCAAAARAFDSWYCRDPLGDELGVVLDQADQRRAARVLPGEAEEVEARDVGDATAVAQRDRPRRRSAA